jgi:hypothetical protein
MTEDYKNTTLEEDVQDITNSILAIQAYTDARKASVKVETIDIKGNSRGVYKDCAASLNDIADEVGLGDSSHPAANVSKIYKRAIKKFTRNFYLMAIVRVAAHQGFDCDDALALAEKSWELEIRSGKKPEELLREVSDVEQIKTNFCWYPREVRELVNDFGD